MQTEDDIPTVEDIYNSAEMPRFDDSADAVSMPDVASVPDAVSEAVQVSAPDPATILKGSDLELFSESFAELAAIDDARNNDICDRFVMGGIVGFGSSFDPQTLDELDFDEFCHVYNTIEWYVTNIAPESVYGAVAYKRFLRARLLERIRTMTVYTVISAATAMPYTMSDGSMLIFTDETLARRAVEAKGSALLSVYTVTPDIFDATFCEYYCAGYETVKINVKVTAFVGDIYRVWSDESYGSTCKAACVKMRAYKEMLVSVETRAAAEGRATDADEKKALIKQSVIAAAELIDAKLMLPVSDDAERNIMIPVVTYGNGKYVALFTDSYAMCAYYKKSVAGEAMPDLLRDRYNDIANMDSIKGIIVNPGREAFTLTKKMLSRIFTD